MNRLGLLVNIAGTSLNTAVRLANIVAKLDCIEGRMANIEVMMGSTSARLVNTSVKLGCTLEMWANILAK